MLTEENNGIADITTNINETEHVEVKSNCVNNITASAINALSDIELNLTGMDVHNIEVDLGVSRGNYHEILAEVEKRYGPHNVILSYLPDIEDSELNLYSAYQQIIDNGGLICASVDGPQFYKALGYPNPVEDLGHAILVTGYKEGKSSKYPGLINRSLIIRDPNLRSEWLVPHGVFHSVLMPELKSELMFFLNKKTWKKDLYIKTA